jgi:methionyl aminopeptidase
LRNILIKSKEQIDGIRQSCQLAAKCLNHVKQFVEAGVTTGFLNDKIAEFIESHGATAAPLNYTVSDRIPPFPKETCISLNEVICHGIPGDRLLKDGDILNIDVTTILNGYYGDTSRMYTVGTPSKEANELMLATQMALMLGIHQVRPGNHLNFIGDEITRYAEERGYSVVHQFCGHGTGVSFHEPPQVQHYIRNRNTGPILETGMIFTIEPMLNIGVQNAIMGEDKWTAYTADSKLSAQYEHTILVTDKGFEILTEYKDERIS